jgi:hypothetical protein
MKAGVKEAFVDEVIEFELEEAGSGWESESALMREHCRCSCSADSCHVC